MKESAFLSESTSFYALKKTVDLVNLISDYLSTNKHTDWNEVLRYKNELQQIVNYAVKANFPNENLESYKLNLPFLPKVEGLSTKDGFNTSISYSNGSTSADSNSYITHEPNRTHLDSLSNSINSDYNYAESKHLSHKYSVGSSRESIEELPHLSFNNVSNATNSLNNSTYSLFDADENEQHEEAPVLVDNLSEARKKYMDKVNSKGLSCPEPSIPPENMSPKISYLFKNEFPFSERVRELNRNVFGFNSFRGVQLGAINSILLGMDCFVLMATGVGKSHCYQLPSLLLNGAVVVFSPLLSLVEDQIQSLRSHGIEAQTLNAKTPMSEFRTISKWLTDRGRIFANGSILFITPEKFDKSKSVINLLTSLYEMGRLKLFVIDEVHCVSQWGHSFRQDYRKLCNLKQKFPTVPILAVTATATPEVIDDITGVLRMSGHVRLITTINRHNLWIEVREKGKNYMDEVVGILKSTPGCGIVYCLTTSDCDKAAEKLHKQGISVAVYHAKMDIEERVLSQKLWKAGQVRIIVATVAFGMGIDKPDVRIILHTSAPTSILSYYQEIGRAGRDGKFSTTILWYSPRDFERHKNINEAKQGKSLNYSSEMRDYCQNRTTCRRVMILNAFGERTSISSCEGCDNCCLKLASKMIDVTDDALTVLNFVDECMANRSKGILTANILCDALRGSKRSNIAKYRLNQNPFHGSLKHRSQKFILDVLLQMVKLRILKECRRRCMSFGRTVLIAGSGASKLIRGSLRVYITCYEDLNASKTDQSPRETSEKPKTKRSKSQRSSSISSVPNEETPSNGTRRSSKSKVIKSSRKTKKQNNSLDSSIDDIIRGKLLINDDFSPEEIRDDRVIDLTHESDQSTEADWSLNEGIQEGRPDAGREPVEFDLFAEDIEDQGEQEISRTDKMTAKANNIRRKIPGDLFALTQS